MTMLKRSLINSLFRIPALALFGLSFLLLSCASGDGSDTVVLRIQHGALQLEINDQLKTKLAASLPEAKPLMDGFQASEKLVIAHQVLDAFTFVNVTESSLQGTLAGRQWVVVGLCEQDGLEIKKTLTLRAYDDFPDLISTQVRYTNTSEGKVFLRSWLNNGYTLLSQGDSPLFWAFQGSSSGSRSDWIKPLEPGYYQKNYMGMNDTDYGGGIPVTSVWRRDVNVATGHLALVPKRVSLPTEMPIEASHVTIGVSEDFEERTRFASKDSIETLETFISVTKGDYFANLSRYSTLMQARGITLAEPEEEAFESIWCAWGYERQFTLDEIIGTLPKVKELGIKWAVLDDGFQIAEGDWNANPEKFPQGNAAIKRLVDNIHAHGLKAKIWWTPLAADPGSKVLREHPDSRITRKDGSPQFISWWDAYYLSPPKEETIEHTKETLRLFLDEWDFDGLKMDGQHMNAVAPDYSLENPESAPEALPEFFQMIYDEARKIKPDAVVENCPCGTCMSYFNMASMNQAVSSDPLSSWQIRHKGKTYKALIPETAYYGDHVELSDHARDFASSFGIGAVLGTKFTWPRDNPHASGSYLLTPEKEILWKKWFSLYDEKMLSREAYLGTLYDIGYDRPEAHAIKKADGLYYAFYADSWNDTLELRGLEENTSYRVTDYFNEVDLGEVSGSQPTLKASFTDFLLLEVQPK